VLIESLQMLLRESRTRRDRACYASIDVRPA
jgi:hypothetical protein